MSFSLENLKKNIQSYYLQEIEFVTKKLNAPWRFVGGCVRDSILGFKTFDIDICTLATPDEIEQWLHGFNLITIGRNFGTIGVFYKNFQIEITTTRKDITTYGRKADVLFTNSFVDDSLRRDFTINALMFNETLYDYHNGLDHLLNKKVIFIGNPIDRIKEDYLRIIRYIRLEARFGSDFIYKKLVQEHFEGLKHVSIERIISEIIKILSHHNFSYGIELFNEIQLSEFLFEIRLWNNLHSKFSLEENLALLFHNHVKIPSYLPKQTKLILNMFHLQQKINTNSNMLLSLLWQNYKDVEKVKRFVEIQSYGKNPIFYNINCFNKPFLKEDLSNFEGKNRYYAELAQKYSYISNQSFQECLNEILNFYKTLI